MYVRVAKNTSAMTAFELVYVELPRVYNTDFNKYYIRQR